MLTTWEVPARPAVGGPEDEAAAAAVGRDEEKYAAAASLGTFSGDAGRLAGRLVLATEAETTPLLLSPSSSPPDVSTSVELTYEYGMRK